MRRPRFAVSVRVTCALFSFLLVVPPTTSFAAPVSRRYVLDAAAMAYAANPSTAAADSQSDLEKDDVKWGIVGLGDVCQKKSGPAFYKCHGSQLVAVARRTPGKAREFADRVPGGGCVGYESLERMLTHPRLDAVYVATRPGTHLDVATAVADAGKACYVEKPVGRCAAEAEAIVGAFGDRNLYTAYISRAYPRTRAIKDLLKDGAIGDRLTRVSYRLVGSGGARDMDGEELPWRLDAAQSGGGLIMDVGCHVLDRIDYICGPLVQVEGTARNLHTPAVDVEDYVTLTATVGESKWAAMSSEGAIVDCTWDFDPEAEPFDQLVFEGPKGSLKMAGMSPNGPIQVFNAKDELVQELSFEMPEHTAQYLIQAITDHQRGLTTEASESLSFGDNAVRTQKVIDTVLKSYYGNRDIGFWEDPSKWPGRLAR